MLTIAATGLTAESYVLNVTADNLANANTNATATTPAYQSESVLLQALGPSGSPTTPAPGQGVEVIGTVASTMPDPVVYDPSNPQANAAGDVIESNVSVSNQMANLLQASTAYNANVTAFNAAKAIDQRALTL